MSDRQRQRRLRNAKGKLYDGLWKVRDVDAQPGSQLDHYLDGCERWADEILRAAGLPTEWPDMLPFLDGIEMEPAGLAIRIRMSVRAVRRFVEAGNAVNAAYEAGLLESARMRLELADWEVLARQGQAASIAGRSSSEIAADDRRVRGKAVQRHVIEVAKRLVLTGRYERRQGRAPRGLAKAVALEVGCSERHARRLLKAHFEN